MRAAIWPVVLLVACANTVNQNAKTGPDGKIDGAAKLELSAEGEAKVKDIVTYPGGDRVDWKSIQLPEGKSGKLELQMSYTTPRPGLRVRFDVFDQFRVPVKVASATKKSMTINDAVGTYFVRVYAPKRGDAGTYRLSAKFEETPPIIYPKDLPQPPPLAAVPVRKACTQHDPDNDACNDVCAPGANRKKHQPCIDEDKEAARIAREEKAEQERKDRCARELPVWQAAVQQAKQNAPQSLTRRFMDRRQSGSAIDIIVTAGKNDKIDKTWKVKLVHPDGTDVRGAKLTILDVSTASTKVQVTGVTMDDLLRGPPQVQLDPPAQQGLPPRPNGC